MKKFVLGIVFIAIVAGAYFGFLRDRYIEYPIQTSLTNLEGEVISVWILGRDAHSIQLKKAGDAQFYDYPLNRLSWFSRAKVCFLPITRAPVSGAAVVLESEEVSTMHLQGLEKRLVELTKEMKLLHYEFSSKASVLEKESVASKIEILQTRINKTRYELEILKSRLQ